MSLVKTSFLTLCLLACGGPDTPGGVDAPPGTDAPEGSVCGDDPTDACQDGNRDNGDGCDESCHVEQGYPCLQSTDCAVGVCDLLESNTCEPANVCGNGVPEGNEECDDGAQAAGDGCDPSCNEEPGQLGSACDQDSECASGACAGVCYAPSGLVIKASNAGSRDTFGRAMDVDGTRMVVGAPGEQSCYYGADPNPLSNSCEDAGAVYVKQLLAGEWLEDAYLKSPFPANYKRYFGRRVAVAGNTIAVSSGDKMCSTGVNSYSNDESCDGADAVILFERNNGNWQFDALVKADKFASTFFGASSIALDGDTLVVGATGDDSCQAGPSAQGGTDTNCDAAGSVYVFVRVNGDWQQQAYLKPSNPGRNDFFGSDVAIDGDTIVVGASWEDGCGRGVNPQSDNNCEHAGAAYVFQRNAGQWSQLAYLKAHNSWEDDLFGSSVAVAGNVIAVGAGGENSCDRGVNGPGNSNNCEDAGAVYTYTLSGQSITFDAYLKASNSEAHDGFGGSIAAFGNRLLVGAGGEDSCGMATPDNNDCLSAGAAYVFHKASSGWQQDAYLKPTNVLVENGAYQYNVDGVGSDVAIGPHGFYLNAGYEDSCDATVPLNNACEHAGAVYAWDSSLAQCGDGHLDPREGCDDGNVIDGDGCAASCFLELNRPCIGNDSCASGVCDASDARCERPQTCGNGLVENNEECDDGNTQSGDGCSDQCVEVLLAAGDVCTSNGVCASGLCLETQCVQPNPTYLKPASDTQTEQLFGTTMASDGNLVAVGMSRDPSCADGIDGDRSDNGCSEAGAVIVYQKTASGLTEEAYIKASNSEADDRFGYQVDLDGDVLVVSAPGEDSCSDGIDGDESDNQCSNAGAVYVFRRSAAGTWSQEAYVKASNSDSGDIFGFGLGISSGRLLVGAPGEDSCSAGTAGDQADNNCTGVGALYTFSRQGQWSQESYFKPSKIGSNNDIPRSSFGTHLAVDGLTAVVASYDNLHQGSGTLVLSYVNANWTETQLLPVKSNGGFTNGRHESMIKVAIDGNRIAIADADERGCGASYSRPSYSGCSDRGSVHIFDKTMNGWVESAYLKAGDVATSYGRHGRFFGYSLHLQGDRLIVGISDSLCDGGVDPTPTSSACQGSGGAYLFEAQNGFWFERALIKAPTPQTGDLFGAAVLWTNGLILIGADGEDSCSTGAGGDQADDNCTQAGAVYMYRY